MLRINRRKYENYRMGKSMTRKIKCADCTVAVFPDIDYGDFGQEYTENQYIKRSQFNKFIDEYTLYDKDIFRYCPRCGKEIPWKDFGRKI